MSADPEYAKGYAAGKRYSDRQAEQEARAEARLQFRRDLAIAALPIIAAGNWTIGTRRVNNPATYASVVRDMVNAIEKVV